MIHYLPLPFPAQALVYYLNSPFQTLCLHPLSLQALNSGMNGSLALVLEKALLAPLPRHPLTHYYFRKEWALRSDSKMAECRLGVHPSPPPLLLPLAPTLHSLTLILKLILLLLCPRCSPLLYELPLP